MKDLKPFQTFVCGAITAFGFTGAVVINVMPVAAFVSAAVTIVLGAVLVHAVRIISSTEPFRMRLARFPIFMFGIYGTEKAYGQIVRRAGLGPLLHDLAHQHAPSPARILIPLFVGAISGMMLMSSRSKKPVKEGV